MRAKILATASIAAVAALGGMATANACDEPWSTTYDTFEDCQAFGLDVSAHRDWVEFRCNFIDGEWALTYSR